MSEISEKLLFMIAANQLKLIEVVTASSINLNDVYEQNVYDEIREQEDFLERVGDLIDFKYLEEE